MSLKEIHILNLGIRDYSAVFDLMKELQRKRIDEEIPDTLIFVEHEEVVTLGPKARREQTSVVDYPTFETDRGGSYMAWARSIGCLPDYQVGGRHAER